MGSLFGRFRRGGDRRSGDGSDEIPLDDAPPPPLPDGSRFGPGASGRIFRFVETAAGTDANGRRVFRSGVGTSELSEAQAVMEARAQAQRALEDALAGREPTLAGYAYHADKRVEPQIASIRGTSGEIARVTVNGYGSLVINAERAMFVDVDTGDEIAEPRDPQIPDALRDLAARRPDLGLRAYRTLAGWRYLCTTTPFDPASNEAQLLLEELGSDGKYILLCRLQRTFRARLTPKPWRARVRPLAVGVAGIQRDELKRLVDKTWRFATARYIGSVGAAIVSPDIQPIVDYHDRWTQATVMKPLA